MINLVSSPITPEVVGRKIDIRQATPEGWDVIVEYDRDHVTVEHYSDWPRVGRRLSRFAAEPRRSTDWT